LSKTPAKSSGSTGTVADQVATFIGRTMGELLNKKDALARQMAEVDGQIAEVKDRVVKQFGDYLPPRTRTARAKRAVSRKVKSVKKAVGKTAKAAKAVSADTRAKMAEAARKRWARERAKQR
jgi:ABC-type transporter Mla subunit MlaD